MTPKEETGYTQQVITKVKKLSSEYNHKNMELNRQIDILENKKVRLGIEKAKAKENLIYSKCKEYGISTSYVKRVMLGDIIHNKA